YKKYAKGLFLSFCLFFSYCIFIQTAGEFLTETNDFWSMLISLKIATDPFFILVFWLFCIVYSITCIKYVLTELRTEKYTFLQYTLNCMDFAQRFKLCVIVTTFIHIPVILFSIYSLCVGVFLSNSFYGVLSLIYLMLSVALVAIFIDRFRLYKINNS